MEEFDISEFIKYYFSKIVIVAVTTIIGVLISWYYTMYVQVPMYKSETSIVLTRADSTTSSTITQSDISLNKNLVATYREIIKSRRILTKVINNLDLDLTEAELKSKISVASANDTELILITVKDKNSKQAKEIANEIASIFKSEITSIYNIENISIVDRAIQAENPYNIHVLKQYLIGFALGFMLGSGIIIIIFYFDDTIKNQEDIENKVGLSVLASVPKYRQKKNNTKKFDIKKFDIKKIVRGK